jgi:hypothetical protein
MGLGEVHTGVLVKKPDGKRPLGRPRLRWEYNKVDLQEVGWGDMGLLICFRIGTVKNFRVQ